MYDDFSILTSEVFSMTMDCERISTAACRAFFDSPWNQAQLFFYYVRQANRYESRKKLDVGDMIPGPKYLGGYQVLPKYS